MIQIEVDESCQIDNSVQSVVELLWMSDMPDISSSMDFRLDQPLLPLVIHETNSRPLPPQPIAYPQPHPSQTVKFINQLIGKTIAHQSATN